MSTRIGVDIGGTFTDLVYFDDRTGVTKAAKVPTTPSAPEEGVVRAVLEAVPPDVIDRAEYFLHGTTVGLNALLERRGAVVGLLATRGFRDVLEIRRGDRAEMYNLFWQQPEPLVPRRLRLPVTERILANGKVHRPIDLDDVRRALEVFRAEGVTSIAVAFINSYANPEHELAAAEALRAAGWDGEISLSHRVSGEYREYERTSTTVIDAFVRGRMSGYLKRLASRLREIGFKGTFLVTRSGGGSMTFAEADERPFESIMSGPVAGAEGAAELARRHSAKDLITADVGGTSFDTCLMTGGRPQLLFEGQVAGMPLQTPWVDVRSIGAGGGSVAWIDSGGLLRVGPRSAGAEPGPASYGKGGTEATTTDAAAVLGMMGPGHLAGGIDLDLDAARRALEAVASRLGYSVEEAAKGMLTIASAAMANTMREITVEQGVDPRELRLLAFGGAGPVIACLLARELDMSEVIVPPFAGNFSAWGLLGADMTRSTARTRIRVVDDAALAEASALLGELYEELEKRAEIASEDTVAEASIDMRYRGQEHWLSVSVPVQDRRIAIDAAGLLERFAKEYRRTFGSELEEAVEMVSVRATLRTPLPRLEERPTFAGGDRLISTDHQAYSFHGGRFTTFVVRDRSTLVPGRTYPGPMIITELTATTYVDEDFTVEVLDDGSLLLKRGDR